jgi:hypothetical protein
VQLLDRQPLYDAALDVDRELTILYSAAKKQVFSRDEWRDARRALTGVVLAFQRVARRELGSAEIQLRQPSSDELQLG